MMKYPKPEYVTELIEMSFWKCANPTHHHTAEQAAQVCILKTFNAQNAEQRNHENKARRIKAVRMWLKGHNQAISGMSVGRSNGWMQQNINMVFRVGWKLQPELFEEINEQVGTRYWPPSRIPAEKRKLYSAFVDGVAKAWGVEEEK